ncbi:MAG TPA: GYD domain-containing protein [Candidatus Dormibacteraeota bacterium]|nr:GYD domain-containing protein [Candidatus Dormibacteraeota bacterium]
MPRYMLKVRYSVEGINGVRKEGGTAREAAARKLVESVGGKMLSFDYAFGDHDVYVICEAPSNAAMASAATMVSASGAATAETVVLLTPSEVDEAVKAQVEYRKPGA